MARTSNAEPAAAAPESFPLTVEEFCAGHSTKDRRVELVAGFYADEKRAGRVKDTAENFLARFDAFANKPV